MSSSSAASSIGQVVGHDPSQADKSKGIEAEPALTQEGQPSAAQGVDAAAEPKPEELETEPIATQGVANATEEKPEGLEAEPNATKGADETQDPKPDGLEAEPSATHGVQLKSQNLRGLKQSQSQWQMKKDQSLLMRARCLKQSQLQVQKESHRKQLQLRKLRAKPC